MSYLPTEVAGILPMLRYLYLLHHLSERGTITGAIFPNHTRLLRTLCLCKDAGRRATAKISKNPSISNHKGLKKIHSLPLLLPFSTHVSKEGVVNHVLELWACLYLERSKYEWRIMDSSLSLLFAILVAALVAMVVHQLLELQQSKEHSDLM